MAWQHMQHACCRVTAASAHLGCLVAGAQPQGVGEQPSRLPRSAQPEVRPAAAHERADAAGVPLNCVPRVLCGDVVPAQTQGRRGPELKSSAAVASIAGVAQTWLICSLDPQAVANFEGCSSKAWARLAQLVLELNS